jgi:hypothetical protein
MTVYSSVTYIAGFFEPTPSHQKAVAPLNPLHHFPATILPLDKAPLPLQLEVETHAPPLED